MYLEPSLNQKAQGMYLELYTDLLHLHLLTIHVEISDERIQMVPALENISALLAQLQLSPTVTTHALTGRNPLPIYAMIKINLIILLLQLQHVR